MFESWLLMICCIWQRQQPSSIICPDPPQSMIRPGLHWALMDWDYLELDTSREFWGNNNPSFHFAAISTGEVALAGKFDFSKYFQWQFVGQNPRSPNFLFSIWIWKFADRESTLSLPIQIVWIYQRRTFLAAKRSSTRALVLCLSVSLEPIVAPAKYW